MGDDVVLQGVSPDRFDAELGGPHSVALVAHLPGRLRRKGAGIHRILDGYDFRNTWHHLQRIVMKVQIKCDKCRSKAMKIAAEAYGVSSVAIEGEDKDQVVVIGDGVDSVCLTLLLRKKVGYASLISVAEVKENKEQKDETTVKKKVAKGPTPCPSSYYPHPQIYEMACYDPSPSNCFIM
ncbi:hypothetical protein HHK36_006822 [Tetracentron sinense]|uniref:HMA domain-containing protein n=1 Tax=Tetracentron sinense TaxID=13715 RepID=A0A835DPK3_TETSI|nr:hypothetical protein HHK36_006822 [Tetracentron sinense]